MVGSGSEWEYKVSVDEVDDLELSPTTGRILTAPERLVTHGTAVARGAAYCLPCLAEAEAFNITDVDGGQPTGMLYKSMPQRLTEADMWLRLAEGLLPASEGPPAPMEVDNATGNRNVLGSNGEEEPVPGGPVVAAGAMGEPDRAGRLLDDNFWEDNDLQESEPAGFLSSLNGSDDDTADEEPAEEEDEEHEGEQRQQPEAATQEGGAEEVGNGTKDPDDDRQLPECFSHELIGKPPKNSSIGGVLVDLLGVKADYELPTAAYEEILYIINTALGNGRFPKTETPSLKALGIDNDISRFERHWCRSCGQYDYPPPAAIDMMSDLVYSFSTQEGRWRLHDSADEPGVASCMECEAPRFVQVRKNRKIILEPDGIYFDFGIIEILWRMLRRPDSAANQPYMHDLSKNASLKSDFGRQLKEATDGAIADAANLIMDVGIDGYKLTGRGYHAAFFACMWCLFQGIHLDGAVRFLGYFAAASLTLWHQAFSPILPPGNGVRDTRARQEGEAQKRCVTEVLRDPGRQCVQSCFAGADGSMLTDTELEVHQRASAAGKLPKGLTGSAHTFLLGMGEVQVRSRGPGSAMIKFKNFYRIYNQRVKNIKMANDFGRPPIIIMGGSSMFPNWTAESFQDFILTYSHSAMDDLLKKLPKHWHTAFMCLTVVTYFRKVIVGKCSKDPERAFAVEVMKQMRLEDFELLYNDMVTGMRRDRSSKSTTAKKAHAALGLVPVDFYIRQTTEQRKDRAFMPTGSAEAENHDMFQEILQVEVRDVPVLSPPHGTLQPHREAGASSVSQEPGLWKTDEKCGTSTFYKLLTQSFPTALRAVEKEPHVFNRWDYRVDFEKHRTSLGTGYQDGNVLDGTPDYLKLPLAAARIRSLCNYQQPPKFIVSLCDPVQRAWKHYRHRLLWLALGKPQGAGTLPREKAELERIFEEGVLHEIRLLRECLTQFDYQQCGDLLFGGWQNVQERRDIVAAGGSWAPCIGVVGGSMYDEQLEYWYQHFPRRDFLLLNTTKALKDPNWLIQKVAAFIGHAPGNLDSNPQGVLESPRVNVNNLYSDRDLKAPEAAMQALQDFFRDRRGWEILLD
eukprot:jgi/Tetstr1/436213/TSEL_025058.t1